ncbi:hypothetical protein QF042_004762 [Pedobacter sp. W3I1]|nr:hypothetical protein [Pedobacter sp. W3I1]
MKLLIVLDTESVNLDERGKIGMIFLRFFFFKLLAEILEEIFLLSVRFASFMSCVRYSIC